MATAEPEANHLIKRTENGWVLTKKAKSKLRQDTQVRVAAAYHEPLGGQSVRG